MDQKVRIAPQDVGVIAPFRHQVALIRAHLRRQQLRDVDVGCIEDFQVVFPKQDEGLGETLKKHQAGGLEGLLRNTARVCVCEFVRACMSMCVCVCVCMRFCPLFSGQMLLRGFQMRSTHPHD